MEEILGLILASPAFREFVAAEVLKIVAELFHRRNMDPEFLTKSDALFSQIANAKTDEDRTNAAKALQSLTSSS